MVPLKPLVPSPAVRVGDIDLLATEAGRTPEGLTATVVPKNGAFKGGCLVCFPNPTDLAAADATLAAQTGLVPGTFAQPLLELWERVEGALQQPQQRRSERAARNGQKDGPRRLTDLGNAERLIDRHGEDLYYCYQWKEWLAFDGTRWRRDQAGAVARLARNTVRGIYEEAAACEHADERIELSEWARKSESRKSIEAMIALAQSFVPVAPEQLDADPWLLNCANGTIELRTGTLREHRRGDLLTKWTGVAYDAGAGCVRFARFVADIMADDDKLVEFLQRALGYSLSGDCREQCLFMLHGSGSNGKSLLLLIVQATLGDYALQAVSDLLLAKRFDSHPTERADLFGKRLVATIEVEEGRRLAESLTKQLTGGDRIRARRMFQDFWEFAPTHKIWLAANHKPIVRGTDNAIWRRIHLIPFTVRFALPGQEAGEGALDADAKTADPALGDKLRAQLPGILAWLVRGCLAWQVEGLKPPQAVKEATKAYRAQMNVLEAWIGDCCFVGERAYARIQDLYASYTAWCEKTGEQAESQRAFADRLGERGFVAYRTKEARMRKGIGLLVPPDDPARAAAGQESSSATAGDNQTGTTDDGVTQGDASSRTTAEKQASGTQTGKSRHPASPASPDQAVVTQVTQGDAPAPISAHLGAFRGTVPIAASSCVTNVSQDPKTAHPTEPCAKGHQQWELARSDPHRGEPRWYGYVCRACRPVEQYGCWLPVNVGQEVRS